jgi:O-antigen/teichoic acid export membrane protein
MSLARRSVTSSAYSVTANVVEAVFMFGRAIALTRLLEPEEFGIYNYALAIVIFSLAFPNFGLRSALVHRTAESEEEDAVPVHFTLAVLFATVWALLMAIGVAVFAEKGVRWVYWVIIGTEYAILLTMTPRALLTKEVTFRRLALYQIISTICSSAVAIGLAWYGMGVWSLLAINLVTVSLALAMFYGFRPVWRPRLAWSPRIVRYYLAFGTKVFAGDFLLRALDQVDDIWTGVALGNTALGFYDRAFGLATYPRRLLSGPLTEVALGTYAELKGDRERLSQAFFMVNAVIIRFNFLLAGAIVLVAPEFIRLVLGARWLPMLDTFRLMLVYTLLDPIKLAVANVLTTSGAPGEVVRARLVQLGVMVVGLAVLVPSLGIAGVALAVDLMLLAGIAVLLLQARAYVNYSFVALFGAPALALSLAIILGRLSIELPGVVGSDWRTAGAKLSVCIIVYSCILGLLERSAIPSFLRIVQYLRPAYSDTETG